MQCEDLSGALAATGGAEGDVRVWDARTGKLQFTLRAPACGPADFGVQVGFVGERILVTAGASGVIRTWDASTGRPRGVVRLPGQQVTELAVRCCSPQNHSAYARMPLTSTR